ncbi:MAG: aminotransferase class V-fold PLP-dependent enzyme [Prolixibacteraceae bacterium]|nr:aminotransferase class V-fold PLP-dependent enzyme [Prolixibacteraceae bacterium]
MKNFHMSSEEFRKQGKQMIDWIADYYENVENYPVLSQVKPGDIKNQLPETAPDESESMDQIMSDVNSILMPGITHWQSPNFFAFFPSNSSGPSVLGDLLSSGLGVQGMLWATSPSCTELETRVLDWLVNMLQLPDKFKSTSAGGAVIQDTASSAALSSVLAARERKTNYQTNDSGSLGNLVAYVSSQTHSSLEKAIKIAGIGKNNLRLIEVDENLAMRTDLLENTIQEDLQAGLIPFFVCATVGSTSTNAIDPLPEIGQICQKYQLWMHIDAAMSGTAAICPEYRFILNGVELADSFSFNPHKWMFTNFDCNCFFVADRSVLIKTLSILPEYLKNQATESGAVFDYRDWHIQLGRRFRSLKLWFVIRNYGVNGLRYYIQEHIRIAQQFAEWVRSSSEFEVVAPAPLNLVCFAHRNGNDFNKKLLETINSAGKMYFTHTVIGGNYVLRMCIGQTNTNEEHVRKAWETIQQTANELIQKD